MKRLLPIKIARKRFSLVRNQCRGYSTINKMHDTFKELKMAPPDAILGTVLAYKKCTNKNKINLGVGSYMTNEGKPLVFDIVKKVEQELLKDLESGKVNKEYLSIDGLPEFNYLSKKLIFGSLKEHYDRIITAQAISGTGSLRIGFEFISKHAKAVVHVPSPSWGNHHVIIKESGLSYQEYPYYNPQTQKLDDQKLFSYLKKLPPSSIILLHAAAHNPTGVDPSPEQWNTIMEIMNERSLIPFFDTAYQGFASGDLEKDAQVIRTFAKNGFQMIVSQSYAKNMGLYGERVGALHIVTHNAATASRVLSQLKLTLNED